MNFTFAAAAVVFSSVATGSVPVIWPDSPVQAPGVTNEQTHAAEDEAMARGRTRCNTCGVVETIRRVEHGGSLPASFEFTVRLRDGSVRTSSTASASKWRSGDRIMLIGGAKTLSTNQL